MKSYLVLLFALLLVYMSEISLGQNPRTLSHQGILSDASGQPKADGSHAHTFKLYDAPSGVQPRLVRPGRPVEKLDFPPEQWWMKTHLSDGVKLALAKNSHTSDTFYLPDTVIAYAKGDTMRYTYTYDASGNMLTTLWEDWDGTQWVNFVRYTCTYDASGNRLTELAEDWNGTQWVNDWRWAYTYDISGNISLFASEIWSGSSWVPENGNLSFSIGRNDYDFYGYQITLSYTEITTSFVSQQEGPVTSYELAQNYPNPFNPSTTIEYALPQASFVTLKVYNVLGEEVATLVAGDHAAGTFKAAWDASDMPSGVYFYRLQAGDFVQAKNLVILK